MINPNIDYLKRYVRQEDPKKEYRILDNIGSGTFGKVYSAIHVQTGDVVAIKIMTVDPSEDIRPICEEIRTLKDCKHENIVYFYATRVPLEEKCIAFISRETLKGLAFMHSRGRIHRDIKGANILLTDMGQVKVADFGVAAQINNTIGKRKTMIGTPYWMAPEVASSSVSGAGYDGKCDIWGVGISAIEYAELQPPMFDEDPRKSQAFNSFVRSCLERKARRRPDAVEMLRHPFVMDPLLSVRLTQNLIHFKLSLEGRLKKSPAPPALPRSPPVPKPVPASNIRGPSDVSGHMLHAYSHVESTNVPVNSVNRPYMQQPSYQSPVQYVYHEHSNLSTSSSQQQELPSSLMVPTSTNLQPAEVVNSESVSVSSAKKPTSSASSDNVYITISADYPNNTGNHTQGNSRETGGQSSVVPQNIDGDFLRDVMDTFQKKINADDWDVSKTLVADKYPLSCDLAKRALSNSDQRIKPQLRPKRLAPSPPNPNFQSGETSDQLAGDVLSFYMTDLATSDPRSINRLSQTPPPRPPPPKLDGSWRRTATQQPFHCGDDDEDEVLRRVERQRQLEYGLGLPATPKVHMGACFTLLFEGCSLMVNSTATWVDPTTRNQIVIFGTNDGIYYLNLVELAEGALHLLVPRRCLWLYIFKDTMMSICGQPSRLFTHNLVSLMKPKGAIQNKLQKRFQPTTKVPNTQGCQLAGVVRNPNSGMKYLCAALENAIIVMEWYNPRSTFIETRRISVPNMPSPLLNFDLLVNKEQDLPLVCLAVYRTPDPLEYQLDLINLNDDFGRDSAFTKPSSVENQMQVIKIVQLDQDTLLVCTPSHAMTLNFQGQITVTSSERSKVLQFGTLAHSIVRLPDSLLVFHAHGLRGISFTGELTQDINDEKHIYRLLSGEHNVIVEKRPSDNPMSEANICLLVGHRDNC